MLVNLSLDDLYRMTAYIYQDGNTGRSREATLLHFVEVCGMLTLMDRKKFRNRLDIEGALCKALGWYFPLLAKMGVESVEQLLFAKYPLVCPYCRSSPHLEGDCKLVNGTYAVLSHAQVSELTERNWALRPTGLNGWQSMFGAIYPRALNARSTFSLIALMEEIGELAEAVRVFDRHPHYFYGEAADVFSYLMGLANEHSLERVRNGERKFDYEAEFLSRYPGLCQACGGRICSCPTIPSATVGRMAKEMRLSSRPAVDPDAFDQAGQEVATRVLRHVSRDPTLAGRLPCDRGDLNSALIRFCVTLAEALAEEHGEAAAGLRELALKLGRERQAGGTETGALDFDVLSLLRNDWSKLRPAVQTEILNNDPEFDAIAWSVHDAG
jgi:NTP pyrophosphatase (non-canonical NTP hydrolase)